MKRDAKFYLRQLELSHKHEKDWRERTRKIVKLYRDDQNQDKPTRFNILWSNTQTQFPALYSHRPKPDVRRRWKGPSPVAREAAKAVERCLEFSMDSYDFDRMAEKLTLDILLGGRQVARAKYHPVLQQKRMEIGRYEEAPELAENEEYTEKDGEFIHFRRYEEKVYEEVKNYHVPWRYYRQTPAECWDDVWWVAYGDNFLTRDEIIEQFGDEHKDVPLRFTDSENEEDHKDDSEVKRAQVWEIWDKDERCVAAVVEGYDRLLMKQDDPLKLSNFFPQGEPALLIETTDSLIPIPEYTMYQFQAEELNKISERIASLTDSMKLVGFYPGEDAADINRLMQSKETGLIPVDNWAMYAEKGGLRGMIDYLPIKEVSDVWQRLIVNREGLMKAIYELIGVSDIQRGDSDPRETRGAQVLKANFGKRRLLPKQQRTQRFYRDLLRINAEIIAEHFDPKTISAMSGTEVTDEMMMILRNDALRDFSIDIETDSTVAPDDETEKAGVAEFLAAMSQFLNASMPIVAAQPQAVVPLGQMLLWLSRKFRISRDVEDEITQFVEAMQQLPQQQNSEAEAKMAELQAELQIMQEKAAAEQKLKTVESEREQQRKDWEAQREQQRKDYETNAEIKRDNAEAAGKTVSTDANVVPIRKNFNMLRGSDGSVTGAEMTENGVTKKLTFQRDEAGNIVGGEVSV